MKWGGHLRNTRQETGHDSEQSNRHATANPAVQRTLKEEVEKALKEEREQWRWNFEAFQQQR